MGEFDELKRARPAGLRAFANQSNAGLVEFIHIANGMVRH